MSSWFSFQRKGWFAALLTALLLTAGLAACSHPDTTPWKLTDVSGHLPDLDFNLTDDTGKPVTGQSFAGQTTLVYFGYTHCPDICPTTMADISVALKQVPTGVRQQTRVVFITTDPARDTPAAIKQWLGNFDAGLPVPFIGLTGTRRQVDGAQRLAGVPVAQDNGQTHSTEVLLYGIDDMSRDFFLTGTSPSDYSHDLQVVSK